MTDTWSTEDRSSLLRSATMAADLACVSARVAGTVRTAADETRVAVEAALDMILGNGFVTPVPAEEWPDWHALTPPYDSNRKDPS